MVGWRLVPLIVFLVVFVAASAETDTTDPQGPSLQDRAREVLHIASRWCQEGAVVCVATAKDVTEKLTPHVVAAKTYILAHAEDLRVKAKPLVDRMSASLYEWLSPAVFDVLRITEAERHYAFSLSLHHELQTRVETTLLERGVPELNVKPISTTIMWTGIVSLALLATYLVSKVVCKLGKAFPWTVFPTMCDFLVVGFVLALLFSSTILDQDPLYALAVNYKLHLSTLFFAVTLLLVWLLGMHIFSFMTSHVSLPGCLQLMAAFAFLCSWLIDMHPMLQGNKVAMKYGSIAAFAGMMALLGLLNVREEILPPIPLYPVKEERLVDDERPAQDEKHPAHDEHATAGPSLSEVKSEPTMDSKFVLKQKKKKKGKHEKL